MRGKLGIGGARGFRQRNALKSSHQQLEPTRPSRLNLVPRDFDDAAKVTWAGLFEARLS